MKNLFKEIRNQVADDIDGYNDGDEYSFEFDYKNWTVEVTGTVIHKTVELVGYHRWTIKNDMEADDDWDYEIYDVYFETSSIELRKPNIKVTLFKEWFSNVDGLYLENKEK